MSEEVVVVKKVRSHKIRLYPNNVQSTHLLRACGIKRFVYNWGLAERKNMFTEGEKISGFNLKKRFNSIKREEYPFVTEVSKCVADNALLDLDKAYNNFFREVKKGNVKT
jgi:putative transposase